MPDIEFLWAVREFVERGGNVLLAIALLTAVMWTLIVERFVYFTTAHRAAVRRVEKDWSDLPRHETWAAQQVRRLWVSEVRLSLEQRLGLIKTLVALCPMFGLLGTVTGMIEVFDVMAAAGSSNARGMASGVSKATLPTMAGMVAALSGMIFSIQLSRYADDESSRLADSLGIEGD